MNENFEKNKNYTINQCIDILKFISTIKPNHKPYYHTKTSISINSWFVTIKRRLNGEKGENGVDFFKNIIESCYHHYNICLEISEINILKDLKYHLIKSIDGIDNLIDTYNDQTYISNEYNHCKKQVKNLIGKIEKTNKKSFFTTSNVNFFSNF